MLDDIIKSPENKIKNVSKILDATSSDIKKSSTVLNKTLMESRKIEKNNFNILTKILSPETSRTKESTTQRQKQNIQSARQQESNREQTSQISTGTNANTGAETGLDNLTPDNTPGTFNPAAPFSIASGTRFNKMQDISSTVSPGGAGQFLAYSLYGNRDSGMHKGLDITGPPGTFIALKVDCEVLRASPNIDQSGFGKWIAVWVPSLQIQLLFGHCNAVFITSGKIPAGKSFATLGSTGRSEGPHIHLQYSRSKNVFQTDGPPDQYATLLYLTKTKSEGFTQQKSTVNTPPRQRQNVLTPQKNQQKTSMVIPQQTQLQKPVLSAAMPTYENKVSSNGGTSLNMIMALAKYS